MEKVGQLVVKGMDLLRQENQEKQIGSGEKFIGKCEKHNIQYRVRRTYTGEVLVCFVCEDEEQEKRNKLDLIKRCHAGIGLSERLELMSFSSYIPDTEKKTVIKKSCEQYAGMVVAGESGGLILLGGVGTGKTHLATAICKTVCDAGKTALLTSVPKIIREIRASWNNNANDSYGQRITEGDVIKSYSKYALLVVDEVGVQYGTPAEKIIISEVINERYNRMRPTVLIGNVKLSEAEEILGARVVDRVKDNGTVLIFDWESHRRIKNIHER